MIRLICILLIFATNSYSQGNQEKLISYLNSYATGFEVNGDGMVLKGAEKMNSHVASLDQSNKLGIELSTSYLLNRQPQTYYYMPHNISQNTLRAERAGTENKWTYTILFEGYGCVDRDKEKYSTGRITLKTQDVSIANKIIEVLRAIYSDGEQLAERKKRYDGLYQQAKSEKNDPIFNNFFSQYRADKYEVVKFSSRKKDSIGNWQPWSEWSIPNAAIFFVTSFNEELESLFAKGKTKLSPKGLIYFSSTEEITFNFLHGQGDNDTYSTQIVNDKGQKIADFEVIAEKREAWSEKAMKAFREAGIHKEPEIVLYRVALKYPDHTVNYLVEKSWKPLPAKAKNVNADLNPNKY